MKAIIREATLADAAALEAAYSSGGWFAERIRASRGVACLIVALVDGLPVAHLDLRSEPYHAVVRKALPACHEVNAMLVHDAAHRSRGVGSAMMGFLFSRCVEGGVDRLGLAVALDNSEASRFFRGLGFETVLPAFAPYAGLDVSHMYMVKQLPANASGFEPKRGVHRADMLGA